MKTNTSRIQSTGNYSKQTSRQLWLLTLMLFTISVKVSAFQPQTGYVNSLSSFSRVSESSRRKASMNCGGRLSTSLKISTRLHYSDGHDDETSLDSKKWWYNMFAVRNKNDGELNEQENVDDYLEFLDRRYKRLHSVENDDENSTPFAALNWLLQGSPSRNEVLTSQHKQEDALYVLGVAGLASQKLLQKHHLREESSLASQDAIDVEDTEIKGLSSLIIRRLVVPIVRMFYTCLKRKDSFLSYQGERLSTFVRKSARIGASFLILGPFRVAEMILRIGGGHKVILLSLAALSSAVQTCRCIMTESMAGSL